MTKLNIFIVEDEKLLARNLHRRLERLGYTVAGAAATGPAAIDQIAASPPDLVLMDIKLEGDMDGVETAEQIRSRFNIPVVYLTAYSDDKTLQRAEVSEPFGYLLKPVQDRELQVAIQMALYKHKTEQKLKQYAEHLEEMVNDRTRELKEAQERFLRQEKLALIGQLTGSIAHELRNPLGTMKNAVYFLELVLESPDPTIQDHLDILNQGIQKSEKIINGLLDFARTKTPEKSEININRLLQEVTAQIVSLSGEKSIEVITRLDEALPPIQADPEQLEQVFDNLMRNAIQAMPEGGQLTITSEVDNSDDVVVSVADTGRGIPPDALEKIFEPLYTGRAKGIGLGLALAKNLVEGHGGAIKAKSEGVPGQGSTFMVRLPPN